MDEKRRSWDKVIDKLAAGADLSRPEGREAAYEECIRYAELNLAGDLLCNVFLAHAATRLGANQVMRDVVREMVPLNGQALLHLGYDPQEGPVLTGNREGIRYLGDLLKVLAEAPLLGEHLHLYWDEPPFYGETTGLVVYLEDDDWFSDHAYDPAISPEEPILYRRDLIAEQVMAIQFLVPMASSLSVAPQKLYVIEETVKSSGDEVWSKLIRDDDSRLWIFTIRDDSGLKLRCALDLDDPEICFLTRDDLAQFLH